MYHKTPKVPGQGIWDIPLSAFRDQINLLLDSGFGFIRFSDALNENNLTGPTRVCVTFDDGHRSNLEAFAFLHEKGIKPASFMVSNWSRDDAAYISPREILEFNDCCDFGGHGATHRNLTLLSQSELDDELATSRRFLEDAISASVTSMAVPGGHINDTVIHAAKKCGYLTIGNSVPLNNAAPGDSVNRIAVRAADSASDVKRLVGASSVYWSWRRARRKLLATSRGVLGAGRYDSVVRTVRGEFDPRR